MVYQFQQAAGPVLISVPHAGTGLPPGVGSSDAHWTALADTDWHAHRLIDFAPELGASTLVAEISRYAVDLNRSPDDRPLYSGAGTGLVPVQTFAGDALYPEDCQPGPDEVARRVETCWHPYHQRLQSTLAEIRDRHGFAVLFDVHSIASRVPRLFEGRLPDLNLGTFEGRSCDAGLEREVEQLLASTTGFSHVVNGRFKGGYITRHYGQPAEGIHALQLEIAQACYMDESNPTDWDEARAQPLKVVLRDLIGKLLAWRPR